MGQGERSAMNFVQDVPLVAQAALTDTFMMSFLPLHLHTATQTSRCKLGGSL